MMIAYTNSGFGHIPSYQDDNMIVPVPISKNVPANGHVSYVVEDVPDIRELLISKAAKHLYIGYIKKMSRVLVTGGVYALIGMCILQRDEPSRLASVVPALCGMTDCGRPGSIGFEPGALHSKKIIHMAGQNVVTVVDRVNSSTHEPSLHPLLVVDNDGSSDSSGDSLAGASNSRSLNFWRKDGAEWLGIKVQFISAARNAWIADKPYSSGVGDALPTANDSIIQGGILSVPSAGLSPAERRKADNRLRAELEGPKGTIYAPVTNPFLRLN